MAQFEEFNIDQGTDVAINIHVTDKNGAAKDLANYSVAAKMKKSYSSDSDSTFSFTGNIDTPTTKGIAIISMTNTQTDAIPSGRYLYDVELSFTDSSNNVTIERILEGRINVTPSVTK